jgi:peptidoglycan hydrolase CwlO-like protein
MSVANIIDLSKPANNQLVPTHLKNDIHNTVSVIVLMQAYCTMVAQKPQFSLLLSKDDKILINLNQHQIDSKRHADYFMNSLSPAILKALTDITGYAAIFQSFQPLILELIPKITESQDARQQVIFLLTQLEQEAQKREATARQLVNDLTNFNTQIQTDNTNFQADAAEANQLTNVNSGELAKLQAEIKNTQEEIRGQIAGVVISSLVVVTGGIVIGVGTLATLPAGVTGASVILGGISVVAAGTISLTSMAGNLAKSNEKLCNLYEQTAKLNTTIPLVSSVGQQVESLASTTSDMVNANNKLYAEWSSLLTDIANFKQTIIRAASFQEIPYIEISLKTAGSEWSAIAQEANQMIQRLVDIAPKKVDNVLEFAKKSA